MLKPKVTDLSIMVSPLEKGQKFNLLPGVLPKRFTTIPLVPKATRPISPESPPPGASSLSQAWVFWRNTNKMRTNPKHLTFVIFCLGFRFSVFGVFGSDLKGSSWMIHFLLDADFRSQFLLQLQPKPLAVESCFAHDQGSTFLERQMQMRSCERKIGESIH